MACRAQRTTYKRDLTDRSAFYCLQAPSDRRYSFGYLITACGVFCVRRYCESIRSSLSRILISVYGLLVFSFTDGIVARRRMTTLSNVTFSIDRRRNAHGAAVPCTDILLYLRLFYVYVCERHQAMFCAKCAGSPCNLYRKRCSFSAIENKLCGFDAYASERTTIQYMHQSRCYHS